MKITKHKRGHVVDFQGFQNYREALKSLAEHLHKYSMCSEYNPSRLEMALLEIFNSQTFLKNNRIERTAMNIWRMKTAYCLDSSPSGKAWM